MGGKKDKADKKYSKEQLEEALDIAKSTGNIRQAAKQFHVPYTTLQRRLNNQNVKENRGPCTVLTESEELRVVDWILYMARSGFPIMEKNLYDNVVNLAKTLRKGGRKIPESFPSMVYIFTKNVRN